jgi:hypothetical protein
MPRLRFCGAGSHPGIALAVCNDGGLIVEATEMRSWSNPQAFSTQGYLSIIAFDGTKPPGLFENHLCTLHHSGNLSSRPSVSVLH